MDEQSLTVASSSGGAGMVIGLIIYVAVIVFMIVSAWKINVKAGKPGWAVLVPIYGTIINLEIIGRPAWWILLFLVPIVSIVIVFIMAIEMAKVFGKGTGFGIGLIFLPFIFYPMLAFGNAQYQGAPKRS
jgi:hypothetical protein